MPSDAMLKGMNTIHRGLLKISGGRLGWTAGKMPVLELTTTGRKSGEPRSLPLIYGEAGDGYVIIASKGGMPNHPVWFLNLQANPECELMVGPKHVTARARVAEGEERERLWKRMAEIYPPYDEYQERAGDRTIPVVVLDPVA